MPVKREGSAIEGRRTRAWRDFVMGALGLEGCKRLGRKYGSGKIPRSRRIRAGTSRRYRHDHRASNPRAVAVVLHTRDGFGSADSSRRAGTR